jgi:hypothetical protein
VDEVLHADNAVLAELLLDDRVVSDGDALAVDLGVTALVDELADGLEVGLAVGDVGLNKAEHLLGGLGHADEDTVVDLEEAEKLEDLLGLGGNLGDTLEADDEVDLGLGGDVEVAGLAGLALEADLLLLLGNVLLDVLVGTLEDDLALGEAGLASLSRGGELGLASGLVGAALLEKRLGDGNLLWGSQRRFVDVALGRAEEESLARWSTGSCSCADLAAERQEATP